MISLGAPILQLNRACAMASDLLSSDVKSGVFVGHEQADAQKSQSFSVWH